MLQLYLHIGSGKTGTSALQAHLAQHRPALAALGIAYPASSGGAEGRGHDDLAKLCIAPLPPLMKPLKAPKAARAAILAELRVITEPIALISAEHLELADPAQVKALLDQVGRPYQARILYVVRSPDEQMEAEYNQLVKLGRFSKPVSDYAETLYDGDIAAVAEAWDGVFGQGSLIARVYDAARPDALGLLAGMMEQPSITRALPPLERQANASLGIQALTAIRLWTALGGSRKDPHLDVLRQDHPKDLPALYMDAVEARAFRARFAAITRRFSARYLGQETEDLGGRRYSDAERDAIRAQIRGLRLGRS